VFIFFAWAYQAPKSLIKTLRRENIRIEAKNKSYNWHFAKRYRNIGKKVWRPWPTRLEKWPTTNSYSIPKVERFSLQTSSIGARLKPKAHIFEPNDLKRDLGCFSAVNGKSTPAKWTGPGCSVTPQTITGASTLLDIDQERCWCNMEGMVDPLMTNYSTKQITTMLVERNALDPTRM
jgi:hypothetical protein